MQSDDGLAYIKGQWVEVDKEKLNELLEHWKQVEAESAEGGILKAKSRSAITGTPVENRLTDLWSLFDFICPGLLGTTGTFKRFAKQLDSGGHDQYAPLRNLVSPYILRRLKTDKSINADLPDKTEMKAFCFTSSIEV